MQFQAVDPVQAVLAGVGPVIGLIAATVVLIVVRILFGEGATQLTQIAIIVIARPQLIALVFSPGLVALMGGRPPGGSRRRAVVLGDIAEPAGCTEQIPIAAERLLVVQHGVVALMPVTIPIVDAGQGVYVVTPFIIKTASHLELTRLTDLAGTTESGLTLLMGTSTDIELVLICPLVGTGNDVDHPADGIRTINGGAWATNVFNALHLIERQVIQFGHTGGQRGTAHPVHQYQCLGGGATTPPQRAELASATIADHFHTGQGLNHIGHGLGLQAIDLVPGHHIDRGKHAGSRLGDAGSGHHHGGIDGNGQLLGKRRRRQQGSRQKFLRHERSLSSRKYLLRGRFLSARNTNFGRSSGLGADGLRRRLPT